MVPGDENEAIRAQRGADRSSASDRRADTTSSSSSGSSSGRSSCDSSVTSVEPEISQILAAAKGDRQACTPDFIGCFLDMRGADDLQLFAHVPPSPGLQEFLQATRRARRASHLYHKNRRPSAEEEEEKEKDLEAETQLYAEAAKLWSALSADCRERIGQIVEMACLDIARENELLVESAVTAGPAVTALLAGRRDDQASASETVVHSAVSAEAAEEVPAEDPEQPPPVLMMLDAAAPGGRLEQVPIAADEDDQARPPMAGLSSVAEEGSSSVLEKVAPLIVRPETLIAAAQERPPVFAPEKLSSPVSPTTAEKPEVLAHELIAATTTQEQPPVLVAAPEESVPRGLEEFSTDLRPVPGDEPEKEKVPDGASEGVSSAPEVKSPSVGPDTPVEPERGPAVAVAADNQEQSPHVEAGGSRAAGPDKAAESNQSEQAPTAVGEQFGEKSSDVAESGTKDVPQTGSPSPATNSAGPVTTEHDRVESSPLAGPTTAGSEDVERAEAAEQPSAQPAASPLAAQLAAPPLAAQPVAEPAIVNSREHGESASSARTPPECPLSYVTPSSDGTADGDDDGEVLRARSPSLDEDPSRAAAVPESPGAPRRISTSSDWTYTSTDRRRKGGPSSGKGGDGAARAAKERRWNFNTTGAARRAHELMKSREVKHASGEEWTEVESSSIGSVEEAAALGAIQLQQQQQVVEQPLDEAGLFTEHFQWERLPPALQVVYDKQGHRQEVIDGSTFWRFLARCTVGAEKEAPADSNEPAASSSQRPPLTEEDLMRFMSELMGTRQHLPAPPADDGAVVRDKLRRRSIITEENEMDEDEDDEDEDEDEEEEDGYQDHYHSTQHHHHHRRARFEGNDIISSSSSGSSESGSSESGVSYPDDEDEGPSAMQLLAAGGVPMIPPGMGGQEDPLASLLAGMGRLLGGGAAPTPTPEEQRLRALERQVVALKQDPEKAHLAECWEQLLNNQEEEEEAKPRQYTPWNLRGTASDMYGNYMRRRYMRKKERKEAAQERARRVALEEEKKHPLGT